MDDNEYTIIEEEDAPASKKIPDAYVILIRNSVLNTNRYKEALEQYLAKKR